MKANLLALILGVALGAAWQTWRIRHGLDRRVSIYRQLVARP